MWQTPLGEFKPNAFINKKSILFVSSLKEFIFE
jgi:hypothetical protein